MCVTARKEKEAINLKESKGQDAWENLKGGDGRGKWYNSIIISKIFYKALSGTTIKSSMTPSRR